ncbi:MAG: TetR/AcrR family transcriptional regulator [Clostridia bacterium]|nr:TetR/AcrR family transcriptional regulator [Clostridia bacterium]
MPASVEEKLRITLAKLAESEKEKISVSALCEIAGVSRASFYLYYEDLEDLVKKTRIYIINRLDEQLGVLLDVKDGKSFSENSLILNEADIALLKGFTGKHIYWEFAVDANRILWPRYEKKMIERWGEEYYNENKEKFEFVLNGGIATLYFDLLNFDKKTYEKNMHRIWEIACEFFN